VIPDYYEDETGTQITPMEAGQILQLRWTDGTPATLLPHWAGPAEAKLMLAPDEERAIRVDPVLSPEEVDSLWFFTRDMRELRTSVFLRDSAFSLVGSQGGTQLKTIPAEHIRSFFTVFRKLYMTKHERGSFPKACDIVIGRLGQLIGEVVAAYKKQYSDELNSPPRLPVGKTVSLSTKKMIDAFLYTQIAHQPQKGAVRDWHTLTEAVGSEAALEFAVYTSAKSLACTIINAGWHIERYLEEYLRRYGGSVSFPKDGFLDGVNGRGDKVPDAVVRQQKKDKAKHRLIQDMMRESGCSAEGAAARASEIMDKL